MQELDKVYNEDCLDGMKKIPSKSIDLVVTDPPYLLTTLCGGGILNQREYIREIEGIKDRFSTEILNELCRVMKKINIYLFCSQRQILSLLKYFVEQKGCNWNLLTWHKANPVPACGNRYLPDTEYILFFREPGVKILGDFHTKSTYFITNVNKVDKKLFGHPTCKPVSILEKLILNSSQNGGVILDPFMGSGSTVIACINTNRHYLGFEINEKYHKILTRRIRERKQESKSLFE